MFADPANPDQQRVYVYGSHDTTNSYCGRDHVVWSAPVDDLTDWRHDGVAVDIWTFDGASYLTPEGEPATMEINGNELLWAPDVVYYPQDDTYHMFVFFAYTYQIFEVSSDSPAGPFTDPIFVTYGFDPGVLVDDVVNDEGQQRIYLYYSDEKTRDCYACELDPDTLRPIEGTEHLPLTSAEPEGNHTMPASKVEPFRFFEGPSIRKIEDTYVLTYPQAGTSDLVYVYCDNPFGDPALGEPWHYGGTVVSTGDNYTGGNIHGGMVEVNGQWYQFYHRNTVWNRRQAMAEPIDLYFDDNGQLIIERAERTSQGMEVNGLDAYQPQYASYACELKGKAFFATNQDTGYDPDTERADWYPVQSIQNGTWLGYKYFNFGAGAADGKVLRMRLELQELQPCTINIYAAEPRENYNDPEPDKTWIGAFQLNGTDAETHTVEASVKNLTGQKAIYLEFQSDQGGDLCNLNKMQFTEGEDIWADDILIGGKSLTGFNPFKMDYEVPVSSLDALPEVSAIVRPEFSTEIQQAASEAPTAVVTVSGEEYRVTYTIRFTVKAKLPENSEFTQMDEETFKTSWQVFNEVPDNWRMDENGLTIAAKTGDLIDCNDGDAQNIFFMDAPGNWQADTKVTLSVMPTSPYQQCAFMAYQDEDNYLKLSYEYAAEGACVQFSGETNGEYANGEKKVISAQELYLRLVKQDNSYTAYYSTDGSTYVSMGTLSRSFTDTKIALGAWTYQKAPELDVTFAYVRFSDIAPACTCDLYDFQTEEDRMLEAGSKHEITASVKVRGGCQVAGHGTEPVITYELLSGSEQGAAIDGNVLTMPQSGEARVRITATLGRANVSAEVTYTAANAPVCTADAAIRVDAARDENGNAVFHVTLRDAKNIAAVQVNYTAENVVSISGENGFTYVPAGGDKGIMVLCYDLDGAAEGKTFNCDKETVIATITVSGEKPTVQLDEVLIAAYDGADGQPAFGEPVELIQDTATFRGCDVDGDGKIDLLDVLAAMKFYQVQKTDGEIWENAQVADVNGDEKVDLQDLISIVANMAG